MPLNLVILASYSLGLMGLGLWIGRRVQNASDFFLAGRRLNPGLLFSTTLAANIGGGSIVGATSAAYLGGLAAWWWVGSAAVGCLVLALWVGPSMRRVAVEQNLRTVGDYLEFRYDERVRGVVTALLWVGSIFILASQLIGLGWILEVVAGIPRPVGSAMGAIVITVYLAAGGLLSSAWVNVVQLTVKLIGFAIAVPIVVSWIGGWHAVLAVRADDPAYWTFGGRDAVKYLMLLAPAFVISPSLLQKVFGAEDDRTVRVGVALNALGLLVFAAVPTLLGVVARGRFPELLATPNLALPMVIVNGLPAIVGAIALAAVFSAEVSAADAVQFMLATSLSQDLYKRFVNPAADDARVMMVARLATVVSGTLGAALALWSEDLVQTLTIFYTLLGVSLFVPIVAGLYVRRSNSDAAMSAIIGGVGGMLVVEGATGGAGYGMLGPAPAGVLTAALGWTISLVFARSATESRRTPPE